MEIWLLPVPETIGIEEENALLTKVIPARAPELAAVRLPQVRRERLAAYALEGAVLAHAVGVAPAQLHLQRSAYGKPYIVGAFGVHYNLSHTQGRVLIGVDTQEIGVDIERIRPLSPGIAARYFSEGESAYIHALPGDEEGRTIEIWTRKEARAKWSGEGLRRIREDSFGADIAAQLFTFRENGYAASICSAVACTQVAVRRLPFEALCKAEDIVLPAEQDLPLHCVIKTDIMESRG